MTAVVMHHTFRITRHRVRVRCDMTYLVFARKLAVKFTKVIGNATAVRFEQRNHGRFVAVELLQPAMTGRHVCELVSLSLTISIFVCQRERNVVGNQQRCRLLFFITCREELPQFGFRPTNDGRTQ